MRRPGGTAGQLSPDKGHPGWASTLQLPVVTGGDGDQAQGSEARGHTQPHLRSDCRKRVFHPGLSTAASRSGAERTPAQTLGQSCSAVCLAGSGQPRRDVTWPGAPGHARKASWYLTGLCESTDNTRGVQSKPRSQPTSSMERRLCTCVPSGRRTGCE